MKEQRENEGFKETLVLYFPEYMLPGSALQMSISEAKKIIASTFEKPNKRKRMLIEVYYLKGLYDNLFSYLSREMKKAPASWINYELYAEYKALLANQEEALSIIRQFEKINPNQVGVSAVKHVNLLIETGRLENARKVVFKVQNYITEKEKSNIKVEEYEYKKLSKLYTAVGEK